MHMCRGHFGVILHLCGELINPNLMHLPLAGVTGTETVMSGRGTGTVTAIETETVTVTGTGM